MKKPDKKSKNNCSKRENTLSPLPFPAVEHVQVNFFSAGCRVANATRRPTMATMGRVDGAFEGDRTGREGWLAAEVDIGQLAADRRMGGRNAVV